MHSPLSSFLRACNAAVAVCATIGCGYTSATRHITTLSPCQEIPLAIFCKVANRHTYRQTTTIT